ncbi:Txe/YoeB family addiction module toxin [Dyadobacter sp. 32]|uniref:Txe/YoeB family addiction module toxin n=1 Tax=Dyadobacter sp. 32 TaxID=538966 RepID=UPI0011EC4D11
MGSGQYKIDFTPLAIEHLRFWQKSGQISLLKKIEQIIDAIRNSPTTGIGKPEMLKHDLAGKYSRRINREHRIIYKIDNDVIYILSMKGHY